MQYIYLLIVILINFILKSAVLPNILHIINIPNLTLSIVVSSALIYDMRKSLSISLSLAFLQDLIFYNKFGICFISYIFVVFFIFMVKDAMQRENIYNVLILNFVSYGIYLFISWILYNFTGERLSIIELFLAIFSFSSLFYAVYGIFIYKILKRFVKFKDNKFSW